VPQVVEETITCEMAISHSLSETFREFSFRIGTALAVIVCGSNLNVPGRILAAPVAECRTT
jgi:hypothetical protein